MKFHSDLFGWNYVWRNFADLNGGTVRTETGDDESTFISMTVSVPVGSTGKSSTVLIAPIHPKKKKDAGIKIVAPFEALEDFVFAIFPENLGHQFGKAVGMQDIKVLDHLFDSKFMIQGSHPQRVIDLFSNLNLREQVLLQPPTRLAIETKTVAGEEKTAPSSKYHAVVYQVDGSVDKLHQLETALAVISAVLEHVLTPYDGGVASTGERAEVVEDNETTGSRRLRSPLLDR